MIFCLESTVAKCCEDLLSSPELLQKESLHFLSNFLTARGEVQKYFGKQTNSMEAENDGKIYFNYFMDKWIAYYDAIENNDKEKATDILCSMIHSFETGEPVTDADKLRLKPICWEIEFSLTHESMRGAFIALLEK